MAESGLLNEVRWEWDGTEVTDESVAVGSSTFTVLDASALAVDEWIWFGEIGPFRVTEVDEETSIVRIDPPVPEVLEAGDPVAPDVGGQPGRLWIAEVLLADADEPVEVVLNATELLYLPEGIYDTPSPIILSSDLQRVIDIPGQLPTLDPEIIDPTTIPYDAWGVTPKQEFDDAVTAIEGNFTDVYNDIAAGDSANQQAIDAAVQDYLQRLTAEREAWSEADDAIYVAIDTAIGEVIGDFETPLKNTISLDPPGTTPNNAGDVWEQYVVNAGRNEVIGRWRGAGGTAWTKMDLSTLYLPKIDIGTGTFGELSGARLAAKTIAVEKLAVTDFTDYVPDPFFDRPLGPTGGDNWRIIGVGPDKWARVVQTDPAQFSPSGRPNMLRVTFDGTVGYVSTPLISVQAGSQFHTEAVLRRVSGASTGNILIGLVYLNAAGGQVGSAYVSVNVATLATDWTTVSFTSTQGVVPATATAARIVVHSNTATVGAVVDVAEVHVRRRAGGSLIVDGSILAKHIDVANLNASGEIVVGINKVTGLSTALDDATGEAVDEVKTMWGLPTNTTLINGGQIATNSILAQSLVLSDWSNYVRNPDAEAGSPAPHVTIAGASTALTTSTDPLARHGGAHGFVGTLAATSTLTYAFAFNGERMDFKGKMPVKLGDVVRAEAWVSRGGTNNTGLTWLALDLLGADGAVILGVLGPPEGEASVADMTVPGWHKIVVEQVITDPAVSYVGMALAVNDTTAGTTIYFDDLSLRRKFGGSLIVDGGITARHLSADSITGLLVTGKAIQTHDDGPAPWATGRGLKLSNAGLLGYPAAGAASPSFAFDTSTGRAHLTGGLSTGTGFDDITITPGTAFTPSAIEFWTNGAFYDNSNGNRAGLSCFDSPNPAGEQEYYARIHGPKVSNRTVRSRIDLTTIRKPSNGGVRSDIWYHAGADPQILNIGSHYFVVNGVHIGTFSDSGLTMHTGKGIAIGYTADTAPYNGIFAAGNIHSAARVMANLGLFDPSLENGGATQAWIGDSGRVIRPPSTRSAKKDIEPLALDVARTALDLEPVTFRFRDEENFGTRLMPGFIAEQAHEVGAGLWVTYEGDDAVAGKPAGFRYAELVAAHNALIKDLYARIEELETDRA